MKILAAFLIERHFNPFNILSQRGVKNFKSYVHKEVLSGMIASNLTTDLVNRLHIFETREV